MGNLRLTKTYCAILVFFIAVAISAPAQTFTTLFNFDGSDGSDPAYTVLLQGSDGNLYGTTYLDGANNAGTVFKITTEGTLTNLYNFCSQPNCADGWGPVEGLTEAPGGNFYGTTIGGGSSTACPSSCGTIFKITPSGTLTTLHTFSGTDGASPTALTRAPDGYFYGDTAGGGTGGTCSVGCGTVFKITPGGALTTLHNFDFTDGYNPGAGLVRASDGNFYGTTIYGGSSVVCANYGCGTIFRITPAGVLTTLYGFCPGTNCADGSFPYGPLVQASNGDLYGTTYTGGSYQIGGTVFKVTIGGTLTTLHSFCSGFDCPDGEYPATGLIQATDGNLYGTTSRGGYGSGTMFLVTIGGVLATLHDFCSELGCIDGSGPGGLAQATNGTLYGSTGAGGNSGGCTNGCGTVFSFSTGLNPFVETNPGSGKIGTIVTILGNNLTGTTRVTFNRIAATFTVVSSSAIKATVPIGATTGIVEVTTPSGTLKSNTRFRVIP
jgi:uncharacterized repeat protein (TIGR03803 family)